MLEVDLGRIVCFEGNVRHCYEFAINRCSEESIYSKSLKLSRKMRFARLNSIFVCRIHSFPEFSML